VFFRFERHFVYWKRLSNGDVGIVIVLQERMHQIARFKEDFFGDQSPFKGGAQLAASFTRSKNPSAVSVRMTTLLMISSLAFPSRSPAILAGTSPRQRKDE